MMPMPGGGFNLIAFHWGLDSALIRRYEHFGHQAWSGRELCMTLTDKIAPALIGGLVLWRTFAGHHDVAIRLD